MKRFLTAVMALVIISMSGLAAKAESIGTVDYEKLQRSYNKAQAYRDDLTIKEQEIEKMKAEFIKQIREAKTAQPNNPVAIDQLQKSLESKLSAKIDESRNWAMSQEKMLETELNGAIQDVAKTKSLTVIIAKQAVFIGGTDITNDVLSRLNAK